MAYKATFEGFPTLQFSDPVETPPLVDLLRAPMLRRADANDVYRYGGETLRYLLDSAPLKHDKKYIVVEARCSFLTPGLIPVSTTDWHVDGVAQSMISGDRHHFYIGTCGTLTTQFIESPVEVEEDFDVERLNHMEMRKYLEANWQRYGFKPKHTETGKWTTFSDKHPHRVLTPDKPEFRYIVNIRESNGHQIAPWNEAKKSFAEAYRGNYGEEVKTIEHDPKWGVIIRDKN